MSVKSRLCLSSVLLFGLVGCSPSSSFASPESEKSATNTGSDSSVSFDSDVSKTGTSNISSTREERILDKLRNGYSARETIHYEEKWGSSPSVVTISEFEFAVNPDYYQYRQFDTKEENGKPVKTSLAYGADFTHQLDDGIDYVNVFHLDLDNEVHYEPLVNDFDNPVLWEDSFFSNAFLYSRGEDLVRVDENTYSINLSNADQNFKNCLSTQFYGYDFNPLTSFEIKVDGDTPIGFKGVYENLIETIAGQQVVTSVSVEGDILSCNSYDVIKGYKPLVGKEDAELESAIESLSQKNFRYEYKKFQGNFPDDGGMNLYTSAEAVYRNDSLSLVTYLKDGSVNFDGGYYTPENGKTQEVCHIKDYYYKNGDLLDYPISGEIVPSFENISTLFFDKKEKGKYVLNRERYFSGYDTCHSIFSILNSSYVNDLTITIAEDGSIGFESFVAAGAHTVSEKVVERFYDIGKVTDSPISYPMVKNNIRGLTWSDIFAKSSDLQAAYDYLGGKSNFDLIPTTEDNHSKYSLYLDTDIDDLEFQYHGVSLYEVKAMVFDYDIIMKTAGFGDPVIDTQYGYHVFRKTLSDGNILEVSSTACLSMGSPYFFVLPKLVQANQ